MQQYLMALGSILLIYISILNLSSVRFKAKEIIIMIAVAEGISIILLRFGEFEAVIPILIIPVIFIYRKTKNVVSCITVPIISLIIVILSDYITSNICNSIFGINTQRLREDLGLYVGLMAINLVVIFLLTKQLGRIINKKNEISPIEFKGKFALLMVTSLVLTLVIFYTNIIFGAEMGFTGEILRINGILFFIYFILLMIIMYVLVKSITVEMENKNKQAQVKSLQEYTANLERLYSDMRAFRHDYINILSTMCGYMQNKDMEGLEKYFSEKIVPLGDGMKSDNDKIGLLKNIKIPELKGIFSSKLIRAQELGLDVFIDIMEPIQRIDIDILDLCRAVGILIDNAIEAAEECDKPSIKVALIKKENSVLIVIINSIKNDVPIGRIYQKGFSTKGKNRGIGLSNLKEIVGRYVNVSLDTLVEEREFKQFLEVANRR